MQGERGSAVLRARNATDPDSAGTRALHGLFWRLQSDACVVKDLQDLRGELDGCGQLPNDGHSARCMLYVHASNPTEHQHEGLDAVRRQV